MSEQKKNKKKETVVQVNKQNETKIVPKLFRKKDEKIKIELVGMHSIDDGQLLFVYPKEYVEKEEENFNNVFIKKDYQFVFTMVTYDKLNRYKSRSMIYNSEDKNNTINQLRLRQYFMIYHLVDWNLQDEEGNKIKLKFDANGSLSDESIDLVNLLPPNLLDLVFATFQRKMNIE